ncbi:KH domain-containing protein [Levilactobacillus brevis]|uniref:KH domain-containing protein n=1 Tax=Levilactobacillus brevis TaxID=1580 RepID=UPI001C1EBE38|nr:KH domain-containing protein [Levilactobacillus brevis]MBU7539625.1 KH domain-containing protein [Levilactobacillus brevis]MBU7565803.1 KH domain-containing protein [Levilactobacillus brevis]MCE6038374.1 KH domain-containing protein [Levilactobacillus brevis]
MTDFKGLILAIVSPLVEHQEDLVITPVETERFYEYRLTVNPDDIGRVIGKQGRVAQAIRTIVYSVRVQGNKRVRLIIDDRPAKTLE